MKYSLKLTIRTPLTSRPSTTAGVNSPHSAFRIPHSAFCIPHSAFRIPHSAFGSSSFRARLALACLVFLRLAGCYVHAQGPPSRIFVSSPAARLISGQQVQLSAVTRDNAGAARSTDTFNWVSSDNNVLSVDSNGVVTGRRLGIATITAILQLPNGNLRGAVRLQVLPLRLIVTPASTQILAGDTLQYSAVATDVDGIPIPGIRFQWRVSGANGFFTQAAGIDDAGLLSARAAALVTVRASFGYQNSPGQFVNEVSGSTTLEIKPRPDFRLKRLLSTDEVATNFRLRPSFSRIAANENGQIAFVANLDGLTSALLLYEAGKYRVLASAGVPGPFVGTTISNFDSPVINRKGEVLIKTYARGPGGLLMASPTTSSFLVLDGQRGPGFQNLRPGGLWRDCFNDKGEFLFTAGFQYPGSNEYLTGLFRYANSKVDLLWTPTIPLPGLSSTASIREFGMDNGGVGYFSAFTNRASAVFRQQGFDLPTRVVGTGDSLAGSAVRSVRGLAVAPGGELAVSIDLDNDANYLLRYSRAVPAAPEVIPVRNLSNIFSINSDAGLLFWGDNGRGWGMYRWSSGAALPVILNGKLAPNGEPLQNVFSASLLTSGTVIAEMQTTATPSVVARLGSSKAVLFQTGDTVDVAVNLDNFAFAGGSSDGAVYLLSASSGSLFELGRSGLVPRLVTGDRLSPNSMFWGTNSNQLKVTAGGDLYLVQPEGILRLTRERIETVLSFPLQVEGVTVWSPYRFAINEAGTIAWVAGSSVGQDRLYLTKGNRHTLLASVTSGPSESGGQPQIGPPGLAFRRIQEFALDESGRVMVCFQRSDNSCAFFLYTGTGWQSANVAEGRLFASLPIYSGGNLKAAGDSFYAMIGPQFSGAMLGQFRDTKWTPIVEPDETLPDRSTINWVRSFDVNRRGEVAVFVGLGPMQALMLRSGDTTRMIYANNQVTQWGDQFSDRLWDVLLLDDRRVFFTGLDLQDHYLLYGAEPLFQ